MIKHDPVEDTPEYQAIKDELERKIIAKVGERDGMGYCYRYWSAKRAILKEDYGIEWHSPSFWNPRVIFD